MRPDGALRRPILEVALRSGFVLLAEAPPDELVVGTIGRFWRATGQSLALAATVKAPSGAGIYTVTFDLVQEGVTWFSGQSIAGAAVNLIVQ